MTKKTRRPNLPAETLARARRELEEAGVAPAPQAQAATTPTPITTKRTQATKASSGSVDLRSEYAYVFSDLRQMGILATAFMVVLVILSFVI